MNDSCNQGSSCNIFSFLNRCFLGLFGQHQGGGGNASPHFPPFVFAVDGDGVPDCGTICFRTLFSPQPLLVFVVMGLRCCMISLHFSPQY